MVENQCRKKFDSILLSKQFHDRYNLSIVAAIEACNQGLQRRQVKLRKTRGGCFMATSLKLALKRSR